MTAKEDVPCLGVDLSTIPQAGFGLFALRSIKKGALIGIYEGRRMTLKRFQRKYTTEEQLQRNYVMELPDNTVIDAQYATGCLMRYINHQPGDKANAYRAGPLRLEIRARKRISKGKEIFFDYGPYFVFTPPK